MEKDTQINKRKLEKEWTPNELKRGNKDMKRWINGTYDTDDLSFDLY